MSKPVRILHVLGGLNLGGAESRVMDLYRNIDREKMQFDFCIHTEEKQHFEEEVLSLGGHVYRVPKFKVYNYFSYKRAWKQLFFEHSEFRAIHGHMTSTASIYLPIAKKAGIPITIAHSRSAGVDKGVKGIITRVLRHNLKKRADYCLTCSKEAGVAVYGQKWMDTGKVLTIPNAIDSKKYKFSETIREQMREELHITDKLVIGHVGSFRMAKNHSFLLDIFKEIKEQRKDAVLLLVGDGTLLDGIKKKTEELGLTDSVIFTGNQSNVAPFYQAIDYLVFPSFFEGLPGTIIEAQTAGLKCLVSDSVTEEAKVTDLVTYYSLKASAKEWASYVLKDCVYERRSFDKEVYESGFAIEAQVKKYEKIYKKNLLLVVPLLHQGGFERICVMTANLLKDKYNVRLAIFSDKDKFYDVGDIPVFNLDVESKPGKLAKIWNVFIRINRMKKLKREQKINITYSFGPTANRVNALSRVCDKIWVGIRGYGALEEKSVMKLTCGRADKVICCAKVMADDVEKIYSPKVVEYLYNPCDVDTIMKQSEKNINEEHCAFFEDGSKVIATMSREDDVKGFWHLIKAFAILKKQMPMTKLLIIGDGTFLEYKKLAVDLQVENDVLFTGVQSNPFAYLKKSALFIMTSITEGFPNALVEAMAVGIPVMSTNCKTGPAEILADDYKEIADSHHVWKEKYGILLPTINENKNLDPSHVDKEEEMIASAIEEVLCDSSYCEKMGTAARERSQVYSIDSYVNTLSSWLNE